MLMLADVARRLANPVPAENVRLTGVSTDSRRVKPGELFIALKGENFDAHHFLADVQARGACAAVVSRRLEVSLPQIVVGDTMLALGVIAQLWRSRFSLATLALTGSNGKTTVKEMLRCVIARHLGDANALLATEGNLNNNIGVPLMMLRLTAEHRMAVFEMGMNHLLEIDYLTRLVCPNVALINMAGTAHIGELGSREAIAQAKGEIYAGLREGGVACINIDDRFASYWHGLNQHRRVITFGTAATASVRGELLPSGVRLHIGNQSAEASLQVVGEHNQRNAIAVAAGAHALGVPLTTICAGLADFHGVDGRLKRYLGTNGASVIDDSYNANPDSMRAAIAVLATQPGRRVLVLGHMAELGNDADDMHRDIGEAARTAGIDALLCVGDLARHYLAGYGATGSHFASVDALCAALIPQLDAHTTVLVKGSRSARMERVVERIATNYTNSQKGHH